MESQSVKLSRKEEIIADIALVFVAIFWGGGFVVVKDALDHMTPMYIMAIRFTAATIIMSLIFWKRLKKATLEDFKAGTVIGTFLFLGFTTQTIGLQYTTAGSQAFLTGTNVVFVPFLAWAVSKKHPGWHAIIGAVLCLVGIGLLTLREGLSINYGDLLTLVCAVFYAFHITSVGHFAEKRDPVLLSVIQIGVTAVLFLVSAAIFEPFPKTINKNIVVGVGYLTIFSTVLAFLIQNVAQKHTTSSHAAIILCQESLIGAILSVIILKEIFTLQMVIGCMVIFIAVIITETKPEFNFLKKKRSEAALED